MSLKSTTSSVARTDVNSLRYHFVDVGTEMDDCGEDDPPCPTDLASDESISHHFFCLLNRISFTKDFLLYSRLLVRSVWMMPYALKVR